MLWYKCSVAVDSVVCHLGTHSLSFQKCWQLRTHNYYQKSNSAEGSCLSQHLLPFQEQLASLLVCTQDKAEDPCQLQSSLENQLRCSLLKHLSSPSLAQTNSQINFLNATLWISEAISQRIQPTTLFNVNHRSGRRALKKLYLLLRSTRHIQYVKSSIMSGDVATNRTWPG